METELNYRLRPEAKELVLYQRTEIVNYQKKSKIKKWLVRKGILADDFKNSIKVAAHSNEVDVESSYFGIMEENAQKILPHIPINTRVLMDIGCGIAGVNIFLYEKLNLEKIYLLDKSAVDESIWYMFKEKGAFYNSLELAKQTMVDNGVPEHVVEPITAPDDGVIRVAEGSTDLIISTISWGYHYPIEIYLPSVNKILSESGILILDVRHNTNGLEVLAQNFDIEVIETTEKFDRVRCSRKSVD